MTTLALLVIALVWLLAKGPRNAEHRPRLLTFVGEPPPVIVTWQCVATGTQSAELCRCVGCWDHITRCFPDAYTWQAAELAWFRHANKAR